MELSVVIATRNRRGLLRRCIDSLGRQHQYAGSFEVVVADDGSSDGTSEMLEELATPFLLRAVRPGRVGRSAARNAAIEASQGTICLVLDDDVICAPELIGQHIGAHQHGPVLAIGKIVQQPVEARDWFAHQFARAWNAHYERLARRDPEWTDAYGANFSVARSTLLEVGGFAPRELAVDIELAFRLCRRGCVSRYLPGAVVVHDDQKRRRRMLEEARLQGAAHVELSTDEPAMLAELLGWFGNVGLRHRMLRRALLALRVPPVALAGIGPVLPGQRLQERWFEFVRRLAFWRGVRRSVTRSRWARLTQGIPILLYHAFGPSRERDRYCISARAFRAQMRVLSILRYRVVLFEELAQALRAGELPPKRAVAITIDDGYADNFEVAQPVLERRGHGATIFLVSGRIDGRNDWARDGLLRGRRLMSADQAAQLHARGIRFGAHTRSHPSLPALADDKVVEEVQGSRTELESRLSVPIKTFAYPYGEYDSRAVAAVRSGGFVGAGTTEPRLLRLDDDPLLMPRIEVRASDSLARFLVKLRFGGR